MEMAYKFPSIEQNETQMPLIPNQVVLISATLQVQAQMLAKLLLIKENVSPPLKHYQLQPDSATLQKRVLLSFPPLSDCIAHPPCVFTVQ